MRSIDIEIKESGSSLLEILIAVMIMALTGTFLVGGLYIARTVSDRTGAKEKQIGLIVNASQLIQSMPFTPCVPYTGTDSNGVSTGDPGYGNKIDPNTNATLGSEFKITVLVLNGQTNNWNTCGQDIENGSDQSATKRVQKIIISNVASSTPYVPYEETTIVKASG